LASAMASRFRSLPSIRTILTKSLPRWRDILTARIRSAAFIARATAARISRKFCPKPERNNLRADNRQPSKPTKRAETEQPPIQQQAPQQQHPPLQTPPTTKTSARQTS